MHTKLTRRANRPAPQKNKTQRNSGFTVTEVVVASALLMIAIVPILKSLTTAHVSTSRIDQKTKSLVLAQGKLEQIRARSIYHYSDDFAETSSVLEGSYLCNVTDTSAGTNLRTITVSVGFDGNGNGSLESGEIEITLSTYIARRW